MMVLKNRFFMVVLVVALFGGFLRLYQIDAQIIGDDEWHGIYYAINASYQHIFTHFHASDNCIPLTLFYKFLLDTTGLTEMGLHSFQLIAGITALFIFPFFLRSIFRQRIIIIFSLLLAISPFLIYYTRYARPYMVVVFCSFLAIFSFYFWLKQKKLLYIIIYVITATCAVYFSLFAIAAVAAPLVYTFILLIVGKFLGIESDDFVLPELRHLFLAGILLGIGVAVCFLPAIGSLPAITGKINHGFIDLDTIKGLLSLFSGCSTDWCSLFFAFLFFFGLYKLVVKNRLLAGYLLSVVAFQFLLIFLVRPLAVQDPVVLARYAISSLPLWLLFVAIALDDLLIRLENLIRPKTVRALYIANGCLVALLLLVFFNGPLKNTYGFPNNFTNHSDFQYDYKQPSIRISDAQRSLLPNFYSGLKKEDNDVIIIESPCLIFWKGNNYYLYQRVHGKRVMIGHDNSSFLAQYDTVMHNNINFKNFVNIEDKEELVKSKAKYVIVHKDLLSEFKLVRAGYPDYWKIINGLNQKIEYFNKNFGVPAVKQAQKMIKQLNSSTGNPIYEDRWVAVFRIK